MSTNICVENQKKTNRHGSILFRKAKTTTDVITLDTNDTKLKRSFTFNKIQSLVVSLSTRKTPATVKEESTIQKKPTSTTTARPLSQFYFSTSNRVEQEHTNTNTILVEQSYETQKQQIKRHSTALDFMTLSSSRSSSLRTLRNLEEDTIPEKKCLIRKESKKLVSVARARTVLGLDSLKSKENRAIRVWKTTISQLTEQENDDYNFYKTVSHPASMHKTEKFVQQPSENNHAMIKFIINELLETEKSYNKLLKLIKNKYMQPMITASQTKDPLVKSTDIPILFNHLTELAQLSDKLVIQFQSKDVNIGYIFRSFEPDLVVFLKYVMHYKLNIKTIKRACNNVLFIKIDQETLSRRDTNRLGMSDYFIAPIQRIPRYCLLIKDLQKHTDPLDPTLNDLNLALKILTGLAVAMDSVTSKSPPTRHSTL